MQTITIGIDPDTDKSGIAIVVNKQIIDLATVKLFDLIEYLDAAGPKDTIVVKVEDPNMIKPLFGEKAKNKRAIREKICQDVGGCKAVARLICELLESHNYKVIKVRPLKGPIKRQAKNDGNYFNKITGWKGRTNEDKRDAAMIALWG